MSIQSNADLSSFNTFSVTGKATELFTLHSESDIPVLLNRVATSLLPAVILGGGSNVLFIKDLPWKLIDFI